MSQKFLSEVTLQALNNATTDTDRFLVSDSGTVKYRTGTQLLSDIGGQATLTNPITGTGTLNFVSKFTSTGSTLGDSQIFDNGTNVGIGTASPAGKLNALGDIIAGSFTYTTGVNLQNRTAKSLLYISTDGVNNAIGSTITYTWTEGGQGPLKFNNTSGEVMRLDASGKLGVGTTNPTSRIHSVTSAAGPVSYENRCAIFGDNTGVSTVYPNSVGVAGRVLTSDGRAIYGDATTGGGWGGYFDGKGYFSGNVGIGTTSPPSKVSISGGTLSVSGSGSGFGVVKLGDPTDANPYVGMYRSAAASIATSGNFLNLGGYDGIAFTTGAAQLSGQPERMRITSGGNVGIGTSAPGVRFVNSGGAFSSGPTLGSGVIGSQALLSNNGLYGMYSGVSSNGDVWQQVQRNDANATVYNLALQPSGGNIYIGTTASIYGTAAKLQILFDGLSVFGMNFKSTAVNSIPIHFTSSTGTQTGYIFQDATSVSLVSVSDYRLKEDLNSFSGLDLISKINVYDYKWKNQDKRSFGVMAHELQEVVPQAAFGEKDGERMQGVDYSTLVPILIQAIKEQQTQIEELKILINK